MKTNNTAAATANRKYNLSAIFKMAWQFVKTCGMNLSEALRTAWRNAKLKLAMRNGIVRFTFKKVDGTLRQAWGTLKESLLPPTTDNRKYNATLQTYYDMEKCAWRCFKVANLLTIG